MKTEEERLLERAERREESRDDFPEHRFSEKAWSAKTRTEPEDIRHALSLLHPVGRRIRKMRFIGQCYNLLRDSIEEQVYNRWERRGISDREELLRRSAYGKIDPHVPLPRCAETDEPLLIEFEDGDSLEIEAPFEGRFRFSMNRIPWSIHEGINEPNASAQTILSPAVGQTVAAVELERCSEAPYLLRSGILDEDVSGDSVAGVVLRLEDGAGIRIYGEVDFTWVEYVDRDGEPVNIPFSELEPGLFNVEDIHYDPQTDFFSYSHSLYFGRRGAACVERPCFTLIPGEGRTRAYTYAWDFDVFEWAILIRTGRFDEYGDEEYSAGEWAAILEETETLLSFERFDGLFDYIHGLKKPDGTPWTGLFHRLNAVGAGVWSRRDVYKQRLAELREWTRRALSEGGTMMLRGY